MKAVSEKLEKFRNKKVELLLHGCNGDQYNGIFNITLPSGEVAGVVISNGDGWEHGINVDRLRSIIERIERLEEEKAAIASDIRDIFAEAKGAGFDVKIMRAILKLRKMNAADRDEQEILLETYRKALDI